MSLEQLRQLIEQNKDNQEVQNYLRGLNPLTLEGVQKYFENNEDGKKWLQSHTDSKVTKGIETWKEKSLPTVLEDEIKKRFPGETEEQKRLRVIEQELAAEKSARVKAELKSAAKDIATAKGLPGMLVDYFVGADDATTQQNLSVLETVWKQELHKAVEEKFKNNGRDPHNNSNNNFSGTNPWKKESFNLTMQAKILKEDPELAKTLQAQA
ncbi:MAG: DUF4355 domain-containing protein [Bacillota bacterium]|nr:DUF4355 domain-containing protein [Bacillota bacterium]